MTKTMSEFERLLNESFSYSFKAADLVKGTVVKMDNKEILVDIGAKSEAVLPLREVAKADLDPQTGLKAGDEREFLILIDCLSGLCGSCVVLCCANRRCNQWKT